MQSDKFEPTEDTVANDPIKKEAKEKQSKKDKTSKKEKKEKGDTTKQTSKSEDAPVNRNSVVKAEVVLPEIPEQRTEKKV